MSTTEQTPPPSAAADQAPVDDLRVFIGNLPLSADAKVLKTVFREASARAQVNVARVTRAQRGRAARYAIVTFKSEEDKSKGVESLTNKFDNDAAEPKTESTDSAGEPGAEPSNGEARSTKLTFGSAPFKPKAPKAPKSDKADKTKSADEKPADGDAAESENVESNGSQEEPAAARKSKKAPKTSKPKRPPTKFVPRPSAVYVTLPPHTEPDEVRELLSGFPSVEIKLGHKRGRTVTRKTKKVEIPERAYAVVTVGEEHQQRAIEQLNGKELREHRITAKPSSQRLLAEDKAEAREAKKEEEAAPEAQPVAEHAEHAESKKSETV